MKIVERPVNRTFKMREVPGRPLRMGDLLMQCSQKKALLFGECHGLGTAIYFADNILPRLADFGFKVLVLEGLPIFFRSDHFGSWRGDSYKKERERVFRGEKIGEKTTPLLWKEFERSKGKEESIYLIEKAVELGIELFGAGIDEASSKSIWRMSSGSSEEYFSRAVRFVTLNFGKHIEVPWGADRDPVLSVDTKAIFYMGAGHAGTFEKGISRYGFRQAADAKYGKDNVLSIDLMNPRELVRHKRVFAEDISGYIERSRQFDLPVVFRCYQPIVFGNWKDGKDFMVLYGEHTP
jgi:hypothetical protein